jgi:LmbE family N-acetylglucosaminyl deacetylase
MKKQILIISPHADDEILGCGGFISKFAKKNYHVNVVVMTNASKGAHDLYSPEYMNDIRKEAKLANNIIGTKKLYFEDLPALNLNNYPLYKISGLLQKYLNRINPEIVLIPSSYDIHEDHKIIFKAAKVALRQNRKSNLKKILSYEVLSETEWNENGKAFNPNYFIRLKKSDINLKVKAFLKYKSQIKKYPHPRSKEAIINLSKVRGSHVFMEYAEAFKLEQMFE